MPQKIKPIIVDSKINQNTHLELNISNDKNSKNDRKPTHKGSVM